MTDPELVRAWSALAGHFADRETRTEIGGSAAACVAAGLGDRDIVRTWRFDVAPVVRANLRSPAGVWTGFDEAWLCEAIESSRRSRLGRVARWLAPTPLVGILNSVRASAELLRNLPPGDRDGCELALTREAERLLRGEATLDARARAALWAAFPGSN